MKKRFLEEQIINVLKEQEVGFSVMKEITRRHGIAEQTFYRWKSKFGGKIVLDTQHVSIAFG